ncbi:uncharacterized protein VTP21DRAFT_2880 [Calcarisporiella thermophila]|uniref:uncharacterized protein n=1 Tax=Calcarisporiella thermophila TaxID=911321 RepID=UPI003741EA68
MAGYDYELLVAQQPSCGLMCGFDSNFSARVDSFLFSFSGSCPITPPPILRLVVYDSDGKSVDISQVNMAFYVSTCDLWSTNMKMHRNLVVNLPNNAAVNDMATDERESSKTKPYTLSRNLLGSNVTAGLCLRDLDNKPGIFFIFQDLCVRTEGTFRLKFRFFDLRSGIVDMENSPVLAEAISDEFTVYPAAQYPGVYECTALERCFEDQGVLNLTCRNQYRIRSGHSYEDADGGDEVFEISDKS